MKTVNNKYLIEQELNIEENFLNYLVLDSEKNERYILCVLKNNFTYEKTREYLLSRFRTIKNLNFDYIVNIIRIEIIYSLNGIKLDKPQYGYLMEYVPPKADIQVYFKECTSNKKLDILMELCAAINTLNMQGYIFEDITLRDIMLISDYKTGIRIKIKNLLQNELRKFNLLNSSVNALPYQYNYENRNEGSLQKDNIGQVINLFNEIFTDEEIENNLKELKHIKKTYNQVNTINKYFKLKYFIKDINDRMHKNYKIFIKDALNKLQTDLDMIGMEEEIKIVEKNFQKILENKEKYKIIAFRGEDGSGKSRFLQEIKYRIENKYFKDYIYVHDSEVSGGSENSIYNDLLKSFFKKADKSLRDKYEVYIKKFISMLSDKDHSNCENKQKLQLINRIGKFINEYTMTRSLVILIDNLDQKNEFFKLFIRYISLVSNNLENVMIVFTMNETISDINFLRYIKNLKELEQYEEYRINYFNQYNTDKMIKGMLNTNKGINKLVVKVYSETLGNPQYISSVIKELYENKNLYFDENTGEWKTKIRVKDILIPRALEKRLEMSLSSLERREVRVLKKMSIFEAPLSEKIILKYIITDFEEEVYKKLKSKKYLIDKISDQGILVGFSNNLLRNMLYLKLHEEERMEMHCKASEFMEEVLYETDYYIEEFLLQLEKSKNYEKAYFYAIKYAKVQEISGGSLKSKMYYEKILKYPCNLGKSEAAICIAELYEKNSEHEKSFEYFEKANVYAIQNDELEIELYTLLEMIIIKINDITDTDTGIDYALSCVRRLLDKIYYPKGEIYYYYAISLKYILEYNYDLALENVERAKKLCEENKIREDIYGWIITVTAKMYARKENYEEAKKLCLYATDIFTKNNNINGQLFARLKYVELSKEEREEDEVILIKYLELSRLSNKHKVYKKEILSLIYIANIYRQKGKYIDAEKYLLKALEREKEEGINFYSFNICNELCMIYIKSGKINLAVKYYNMIRQMQKAIKLPEEQIISFNYTYALYNLLVCNYDMAYDYLKEVYGLIFNTNNFYHKVMICKYYELILYKCKCDEDIKNVYSKLNNKIELLNKPDVELEIRLSAIKRILNLGYKELAKDLFFKIKEYPRDYNVEGVYIYLEFNLKDKNCYNFLINKALKVCAFISNQETKADLYAAVGKKYNELKCYDLAINYYYEAISLHMDVINSLPEYDKLSYINNSDLLKLRSLFARCLNYDLNMRMSFKETHFIKNTEEINRILMELNLENILKNEEFFKLAQRLYEKCYYNDLNDAFKVFEQFSGDTIKNMENIIKYISRLVLADKAMIITESNEGGNDIICTYRINDKNEINKYFSLKVDTEEDVFIICNNDTRFYQLDNKILKDGIKSCMYMKIINREETMNNRRGVNARLILIADNAINYINNQSKITIEKFKPFLIFLLEKYYLTINSALDKLTEVYNRKYFEEALLFLLDKEKLEESKFAVMMFDIDDFKGINDTYGHQTGDEVLVRLVKEVKKCIGKDDIIGRYGGEEFIILCPDINEEEAIRKAENIRLNVEEAKILGDKRNVTISIGIAMSVNELLSSDEMIGRADQALYKAKNEGKNRYVLWEKEESISRNINNELAGVLSGNMAKDYSFALDLKGVANLVKYKGDKIDKIYIFISKVMQVIECEIATVFEVKDKKIINNYSKLRNEDGWYTTEKFNWNLIYKVIEEEKGMYLIDWETMGNYNQYGMPEWKSICIAPIICNGNILSVLYLSIPVNKKEFGCNEYNLLNCFAEVGTPIFLT
ncbi:diguanylate cyclase with TPR repeats [Clostridium sp. DL-VIII]|uniref:diguanylate cyclase n=1 Tax=Clostridium sp. DL-VIII TaxID=641107 RepID=UPI00023B0348|nr:diguanylate cyclase [Clostridium sp. DL-VIII]EHJ01805.1 diguanylate cyclase with TPR repeats [Clostridium sp. DL-VIII]